MCLVTAGHLPHGLFLTTDVISEARKRGRSLFNCEFEELVTKPSESGASKKVILCLTFSVPFLFGFHGTQHLKVGSKQKGE